MPFQKLTESDSLEVTDAIDCLMVFKLRKESPVDEKCV